MGASNKFATAKEFLASIEKQFSVYISEEDFSKLGIKKKADNFYYTSQFFEIKGVSDRKNFAGAIKTISISDYEKAKHIINPEFPIVSFDMLEQCGRTAKIEAYNFSLLLFTEEFQKFIEETRATFDIPSAGISISNRVRHFKTLAEKWHRLGLLEVDTKIEQVGNAMSFAIENWLGRNTDYNNKNYEKRSLLFFIVYDYILSNNPFISTALIGFKRRKKGEAMYDTKTPLLPKTFLDDNIEINIVVYYETTKEEVKEAIDSAWKTIEAYKKRLPGAPHIQRIKNIDLLKTKWEVYHRHKIRHETYKIISARLKISEANARKIVSEISKDVLKLKSGKLLP